MNLLEWPTEFASEFEKDGETWIIIDGEEWSIDVQFVDDSHWKCEGGNNYPTDWKKLCRLIAPYSRTFGKKHG